MLNYLKYDKTSGASELIETTLDIIQTQLKHIKDPKQDIKDIIIELSKEIFHSRPSMAPIINAIGFVIHDLEQFNKDTILQRIEQYKLYNAERKELLNTNFKLFLDALQVEHLNIMLISYSSTLVSFFDKLTDRDYTFYILESRPLLEGRRTAEILSSKYEVNLITDSAIGKFIPGINLILTGIDSMLKDGSIINKIGTYPLATIGKLNNKKVYGVADGFKYNLKSHYDIPVIIEEKPEYEIYSKKIKIETFKVHNYYFDITPPQYFDGIISDLGILTVAEFLTKVKAFLPLEWYKIFL
jgi:translation initiation factor 2B subunit (eIF-2B alpha/beta/delta family)